MKLPHRVYVAGPYSSNKVIGWLANMCYGLRKSVEVLLAGFAPFSPWLDYLFSLVLRPGECITIEMYYAYSMAWLDVSEALFVLDGWENSKGTLAEIARAEELGIPIVHTLDELKTLFAERENEA